jgi:transcriptional regulator with XRE-family HTH domain
MTKRQTAGVSALRRRVQEAFGSRLKAARRENGQRRVKQDAIAEALEVTRTSVSNIERGRHRVFLDQAYLAARALGIEVSDLLPAMDEVFSDAEISTSQSLDPRSAREVIALVDLIRERAVREVLNSKHATVSSRTSKKAR